MHSSWKGTLREEFGKPYFKDLVQFVNQERQTSTVYPPSGQVFRAYALTPYDQVKVVILGQDPYHGPGQAHGLAFSVPQGEPLPPSLRNIYEELRTDVGVRRDSGDLTSWAEQGVLLLNTTLIVRQGQAGSHQGKGWELFTNATIQALCELDTHIVFLLWGNAAKSKAGFIDSTRHVVVQSAHPSPFSATHGFFGSKPFSKANEALCEWGRIPVQW